MASDLGRTILLLPENEMAAERPAHIQAAAYLPISVALFGIAVILIGGLSVSTPSVAKKHDLDPIATGSIVQVPAN